METSLHQGPRFPNRSDTHNSNSGLDQLMAHLGDQSRHMAGQERPVLFHQGETGGVPAGRSLHGNFGAETRELGLGEGLVVVGKHTESERKKQYTLY